MKTKIFAFMFLLGLAFSLAVKTMMMMEVPPKRTHFKALGICEMSVVVSRESMSISIEEK